MKWTCPECGTENNFLEFECKECGFSKLEPEGTIELMEEEIE